MKYLVINIQGAHDKSGQTLFQIKYFFSLFKTKMKQKKQHFFDKIKLFILG